MEHLNFFREINHLLKLFTENNYPSRTHSLAESKQSICFYPGSFNPWHLGHTSCVTLHFQHFANIPLMILPDHNPQKDLQPKEPVVLLKSITENIQGIDGSQIFISEIFINNTQTNPTQKWVTFLRQYCPNLQIGLLMGLDSYLGLTSWYKYELLINDLNYLEVIPRKIDNLQHIPAVYHSQLQLKAPKLQIHHVKHNPFESVSSTQLRQK